VAKRRGNNEGSIYQRKDGSWCATVSAGYSPATGKPIRKYAYGKTRKEVAEKLRKLLEAIAEGTPLDRRDITIEKLMEEYLADIKPTLRPKTITIYEMLSRVYVVPRLGKMKVSDLTAQQVAQWQRALLTSGGDKGAVLSPRTVQMARAVLKRALDLAIRYDWVARNVVDLATPPPSKKRVSPNLSKDDAQAILKAFEGDTDHPLVVVIIGLGLRIGEALGIRWEDVDFEQKRVRIAHQLVYVNGSRSGPMALQPTKTAKGVRSIALPAFVIAAFEARKAAQEKDRAACLANSVEWGAGTNLHGGGELDLVFTTHEGNPRGYSHVRPHFATVLKRAGIEGIVLHDLRKLCASLLVSQGVHPRVIMGILGHANIAMTMEIYAAVMPGTDSAAAAALDQALEGFEGL
jgi:integrase